MDPSKAKKKAFLVVLCLQVESQLRNLRDSLSFASFSHGWTFDLSEDVRRRKMETGFGPGERLFPSIIVYFVTKLQS